jgi:hypothetical protein
MSWEELCDELKALGPRLMGRIPERLRSDPHILQDSHRLLMYGVARGLIDAVVADREHPMVTPEISLAMNIFQPNADTAYKSILIDGDGVYRIKGERGSTRMFVMVQLPDIVRTGQFSGAFAQHDFDELTLDGDGRFDVIVSRERPEGHQGDWWPLDPRTRHFMIRIVSCDWGVEREPRFGVDRLDRAPSRHRLAIEEISRRMREIPVIAGNAACAFPDHVEQLRNEGFLNKLKVFDLSNMVGLGRQFYYEGAYELADDEALIVEAKVPDKVRYWSLILTNDIYETTDWENNQASLNDTQARVDGDGWFRAVISARDPGVPNWLDTCGYATGAIQGRWFDASSQPVPEVRKVKLSEVRAALPADTPQMTPEERDAAIRARRINAQKRVIW